MFRYITVLITASAFQLARADPDWPAISPTYVTIPPIRFPTVSPHPSVTPSTPPSAVASYAPS